MFQKSSTESQVIKAIRAHRGIIKVGMLGTNDVYHIKVVKSVLLDLLGRLPNPDGEFSTYVEMGILYLDRNY
jgi:hypothetical protein